MKKLTGISASPGIVIGKPFLFIHEAPTVPRYDISESEIDSEMDRFRAAIERTIGELKTIREQSTGQVDSEQLAIIEAHQYIATDPEFESQVLQGLTDGLMNVEWVLHRREQELLDRLSRADNAALRERATDLRDVSGRVLNQLLQRERFTLADLTEEVIVVAHDLMPSDAIVMNKDYVKGIAMDGGGPTSHTAILARAFEIPSVLGLTTVTRAVVDSDRIIVDGNRGVVVINPDAEVCASYEEKISVWRQHELQLMRLNDLPAETKDGKLIALKANIEVPEEVGAVLSHGADGIGLYRSEFLFMSPGRLPSEEAQYRAYRSVLEAIPDKPVTIRTLDVGGDKVAPQLDGLDEHNPILGWRAIRFCLANRDVFRTQLRAMLRASQHGRMEIMFPMISGLEELSEAISFLAEVKKELKDEGVPFSTDLPVGIMIEVPSAALVADILSRRSDFFSIGTNDLIQYTLAVDRGNERVAYLYEPFHPGVLRLLKMVIDSAHANGIPVAMCGEMAGDPVATLLLLGLGLDEYSMSAGSIPEVKRIIRSTSIREAEEVVGAAMEMRSFREVDKFVRRLMEERFGVSVG
jgi:phosphoenolpyruvate-protein phosphotransferase (PTS system enzyme I)